MSGWRRALAGLLAILRRRRHDEELSDELSAFLDAAVESKLQQGMTAVQARRIARAELGGVESVKDSVREIGWEAGVFGVWRDLVHAARSFIRRPVFSAVAIASIALGVGAAAVIGAWSEALLLRPLGSARQQRDLRVLHVTTASRDSLSLSYPGFLDLRAARSQHVADVGVFTMAGMTMRVDDHGERVWGQLVSGNLFHLLRVNAARGRTLGGHDEMPASGASVAVLSHDFGSVDLADVTIFSPPPSPSMDVRSPSSVSPRLASRARNRSLAPTSSFPSPPPRPSSPTDA